MGHYFINFSLAVQICKHAESKFSLWFFSLEGSENRIYQIFQLKADIYPENNQSN